MPIHKVNIQFDAAVLSGWKIMNVLLSTLKLFLLTTSTTAQMLLISSKNQTLSRFTLLFMCLCISWYQGANRCIVSPPNMVGVTAIPCKILIMTLPICLYMFATINNNKYKNICTLDTIHVTKRHNTDYGTLLKCYAIVKKDFWQHKCPLLLRIAWNLSLH